MAKQLILKRNDVTYGLSSPSFFNFGGASFLSELEESPFESVVESVTAPVKSEIIKPKALKRREKLFLINISLKNSR